MAGAGRSGVKLLSERPEITGSRPRANARGIETGSCRPDSRRGLDGLEDSAGDVRAGSDEFRFPASIGRRPTAGKSYDVVGAVCSRIAGSTLIGCAKRMDVFRSSGGDDVLHRAGSPHGICARSVISGGKDNHMLLIAGSGKSGTGRLRIANQRVVSLRIKRSTTCWKLVNKNICRKSSDPDLLTISAKAILAPVLERASALLKYKSSSTG